MVKSNTIKCHITKKIENMWKTSKESTGNYLQLNKHPELFIPQTFTKANHYNPQYKMLTCA